MDVLTLFGLLLRRVSGNSSNSRRVDVPESCDHSLLGAALGLAQVAWLSGQMVVDE